MGGGLCGYMRGLDALLKHVQRRGGQEAAVHLPVISHLEKPPDGGPTTLRAQLLERVVLICIATGRDKDMELAKKVFTNFVEARQSASLIRLLGMLQSSGSMLDL